jgi:GxxExxY protein
MTRGQLIEDDLTRSVIGAFYEVYNELGFGFLEHPCGLAMERELRFRNHVVIREYPATIYYKLEALCEQRLDMVVDGKLIVEIKSSPLLPSTAKRQLYNYLRATDFELGLLLHFGPEPKFYRQILTNDLKRETRKSRFGHGLNRLNGFTRIYATTLFRVF